MGDLVSIVRDGVTGQDGTGTGMSSAAMQAGTRSFMAAGSTVAEDFTVATGR
jgi:hypothetical protein